MRLETNEANRESDWEPMGLAEESLLEAAFRKHYGDLVRMAVLLTADLGAAEDLVQESFLRATPRLTRVDADQLGAYLRKIVVNLWKNAIRRSVLERRHLRIEQGDSVQPTDDASARLDMVKALRKLSRRQHACVVLRFYEDLSEPHVAQLLGVSVGAVKKHTARAMAKLREELSNG